METYPYPLAGTLHRFNLLVVPPLRSPAGTIECTEPAPAVTRLASKSAAQISRATNAHDRRATIARRCRGNSVTVLFHFPLTQARIFQCNPPVLVLMSSLSAPVHPV